MKKIFKTVTFIPRKLKNISKDWIIRKIERIKNNKSKVTYQKSEISYEIEMIDKTVDFLKGVVHETYKITQKVRKSGIIQKITIGLVTILVILSLNFKNGKREAVQLVNITPTPIEIVIPQQAQDLSSTDLDQETANFDNHNQTVLEKVLGLSGGDQNKFGPGARAKADAWANSSVSKMGMGKTSSSGSTIFAESFTPSHIYCNNYHNARNKLSCPQAYNHNCPPGNQGGSIKLDDNGYCIGKGGNKFVRVEHEHKKAKFVTPENQNDPVQDVSEVIGTEKIRLTTDV